MDLFELEGLGAKRADTAPKQFFEGTHRVCAPETTLARVKPYLAELGITRVANVTGLDRTGIPVVTVCRPNSRSTAVSQGKGLTLAAAKASGIMEALELWHGEHIVRPLKFASAKDLRRGHRLVDTNRLPIAAGRRFPADLSLLWIEATDLLGGGPVWVPLELVSTDYRAPAPPGSGCFHESSNGLASGNHVLEAVSHAICEVIERDANALWLLQTPQERASRLVDPATIDDPACRWVLERLRTAELEVRVWETTSNVRVASFVCLVMESAGQHADPEYGAGCHPVRQIALLRALTEAAQARNSYISGARDDFPFHAWDEEYRRYRHNYCAGLMRAAEPHRAFDAAPSFESASIEDDLRWLFARVRAAGIEQVLAVDLSHDAIGIPVVRVIVPGLEGLDHRAGFTPAERARKLRRLRA